MVIFSPAGIFTRDAMFWSPSEWLFQGVQSGARLEPPDLLVGERMEARDGSGRAVGLGKGDGHGRARSQLREPVDAEAITRPHEVVVGRLREREGQDALLLQVGLVNPREAPH